jgi:hypothetical protein
MALGEAELLRIGEYVKGNLKGWVLEVLPPISGAVDPVSHTMLMERVVRVEEELKAQRELMQVRFDAADQRFESLQATMDQRFAAVDQRFVAVDQRFESLQTMMDQRFVAVDQRFAAVDQRFEDLLRFLDRRFTAVDKRFGVLQWSIGILAALVGTVLAFVIAL